MTSRALNNKINPAFGLFKNTVAKNVGGIILLSLAMLIFCPGFFIASLSKQTLVAENYPSPDSLSALFGVSTLFSCMLICVANFVNFSYLYKKSSSDVFHALPLTRFSLFISRAAAGFTSLLIPVTLGYVALSLMTLRYPTFVTGTIAQIASAYLLNILFMIAFSAFSMIFIVCAGSGFDLVLSFFGFNISLLMIAAILESLCDTYLTGFYHFGLLEVISPPYNLIMYANEFANNNNYSLAKSGYLVFDIILYAIVFSIIGLVLYRFRKAERGEQAYAYKFLYMICGALIGICGGYALSQIFVFAVDTKSFSLIGFLSFIAGALLTTVIYGAVTDRGFKGFKHSLYVGGASIVAYGLTAVIILTGGFGFEKRIPKAEKIAQVSVVLDANSTVYADPESAIALHKAILDKSANNKYMLDEDENRPYAFLTVNYTLKSKHRKSGGTLQREYYIDESKVKKELFDIYSSDNRFDEMNKSIDKTTEKLEISGDYNKKEDYQSIYGNITKSEAKKLIATYKKEFKAIGEDVFSAESNQDITTSIDIYTAREYGNEMCVHIFTTKDFTETNKMILKYQPND